MNTELKAMLELAFDGFEVGQKVVAKENFFNLLPKLFEILTQDVPSVVLNIEQFDDELKHLAEPAVQADLIAFIKLKFASVSDDHKAQAILAAALKLVQDVATDVLALQAAIKN